MTNKGRVSVKQRIIAWAVMMFGALTVVCWPRAGFWGRTMILVDVALLLFMYFVLCTSKGRGWYGELMMRLLLWWHNRGEYVVLNNVYLPLKDGTTTQIDHIVVSAFGVFVIETKTYSGWIFGDAQSKVWTQCIRKKGFREPIKHTFQNPIRQNYLHLCSLEECTDIPNSVMKPIIAFAGTVEFKMRELPPGVMYFGDVGRYITSFKEYLIKPVQIDEIAEAIREWQATIPLSVKLAHVANLQAKHAC